MPNIKETLVDLLTGYSLDTYEDVQYVADELIAKSVVPVVRCEKCLHWDNSQYANRTIGLCNFIRRRRGARDFCSYGERKEG